MEHTFVVCAYKISIHLEECILSLINQSIKSNIIICTSTPNEHIEQLSKKYGIKVYVNLNGGIGQDWNFALNNSPTKYVTIAHQDDIYLPDYAKECLLRLRNKDSLIVCTMYREIKNGCVIKPNINLKIKGVLLTPLKVSKRSVFLRMLCLRFGNSVCCPSVSLNMHNLNSFQFSEEYKCDLDWDAWDRIFRKKGSVYYINKELMYHRIHEDSETSSLISENVRTNEDLIMFKRYWPIPIATKLNNIYKKSLNSNII